MLPAPLPRSLKGRVECEESTLAGRPAEVHTPSSWRSGAPSILYLHGGGYAVCSPASHRDLCARLAAASNARVVALDYRLAPEDPYPAGVEDAVAAWRELAQEPGPCALGGDSAGGGLSLALMLRLRAANEPMPQCAILLSPWVDLTCASESIDTMSDDYLDRGALERFAEHYLQGQEPTLPEVSPLFADLRGFPPTLVMTGGSEVFFDENRRLVERLGAAGVEVSLRVGHGMVHVWPAFAPILPEGREAIQDLGGFVSRHVVGEGGEAGTPVP